VEDNVCVLKDDMADLRAAIVEADAYVIGGANYFRLLNGLTHCFLERWYQFRHQEGKSVSGKIGAAVGIGGGDGVPVVEQIRTFFEYNQVECIGSVVAQGPASCFVCGYGETCRVGAIHAFFGPDTKITDDIIPSLEKQPEVRDQARELGASVADRLKQFGAGT
jgi:multimeric flavodoxin WrbA